MDNKVKLAIIGTGSMGSSHCGSINKLHNCTLTAICDINKQRADKISEKHNCKAYYDYKELIANEDLDGVIIATPHYAHTTIGIYALEKGLHVLTEKPISVHVKDAVKLISAYRKAKEENDKLIFAAMFQQRTLSHWKKIKELIDSDELGKLVRTTWIITTWFRTQFYYDKGGWRATWEGEGGGVLLNQCPHNLDLYQWMVGMPDKITGFASFGKYHNIEVEDEVTGYFEHANGMVGHFITSTGESPGTNRLEIVGENGKLVFENDTLTFYRNRKSMLVILKDAQSGFAKAENWKCDISFSKGNDGKPHDKVIENFADAITKQTPLIANAEEGINSVGIGNAITLSALQDNKQISIPLDGDEYESNLKKLIKNSTFVKQTNNSQSDEDMSASF
jgi:predicted dehydrogenase